MKAAKEYREIMKAVFQAKEIEAKNDLLREDSYRNHYQEGYLAGYLAGLKEAVHTIDASEFLTE